MIVVSDTSCITNLLTIGQESLLPQLFGEVFIPPAVERELLRFHSSLPAFLKCKAPTDAERVSRLTLELDPGEAEAISLACEMRADRLLIDESVGRGVALREGLAIIGLVGLFVLAKRQGRLASVRSILDQLESEAGFRLSQSLKNDVLRSISEG